MELHEFEHIIQLALHDDAATRAVGLSVAEGLTGMEAAAFGQALADCVAYFGRDRLVAAIRHIAADGLTVQTAWGREVLPMGLQILSPFVQKVSLRGVPRLPSVLATWQQVQHLEAWGCRLASWDELPALPQLRTLLLQGTADQPATTLARYPLIESLHWELNAALPSDIGNLAALRHVYFRTNDFRRAVINQNLTAIVECRALQTLHLAGLWAYDLPAALGSLHQLETLTIQQSLIKKLPHALRQLPALRSLALLQLDNLATFPTVLHKLRPLRVLHWEGIASDWLTVADYWQPLQQLQRLVLRPRAQALPNRTALTQQLSSWLPHTEVVLLE